MRARLDLIDWLASTCHPELAFPSHFLSVRTDDNKYWAIITRNLRRHEYTNGFHVGTFAVVRSAAVSRSATQASLPSRKCAMIYLASFAGLFNPLLEYPL